MIPLRDENPSGSVPVVTRTLIVVNCLIFLYELLLGPELRGFMMEWGLVPARLTAAWVTGDEPLLPSIVPAVSSMFLHGGWLHLIGNMWYLWIFGDNVEDRLGRGRFIAFYLVAGLFASAMHYAVNPHSPAPTIGASGAIAGLLGAYLAAFPQARVITLIPIVFFLRVTALPAYVMLGFWFVYQLFSGALSLGGPAAGGGVAWWAHIGGFAFGWVLMKVFGRRPQAAYGE